VEISGRLKTLFIYPPVAARLIAAPGNNIFSLLKGNAIILLPQRSKLGQRRQAQQKDVAGDAFSGYCTKSTTVTRKVKIHGRFLCKFTLPSSILW
jgi:hypothetical protein